jgi:hypothetical protein
MHGYLRAAPAVVCPAIPVTGAAASYAVISSPLDSQYASYTATTDATSGPGAPSMQRAGQHDVWKPLAIVFRSVRQ